MGLRTSLSEMRERIFVIVLQKRSQAEPNGLHACATHPIAD